MTAWRNANGVDMPITSFKRDFFLSRQNASLIEILQERAKYAQDKAVRHKSTKNELKAKKGYVYLMYFGIGNLYKIGTALRPDERLNVFKGVLSPFDMTIEHLIEADNANLVESSLHQYFIGKHFRGEWFTLDHDDIELIKSIQGVTVYTGVYNGNKEPLPIAI